VIAALELPRHRYGARLSMNQAADADEYAPSSRLQAGLTPAA
jgi:hypothetical protein